jgi:hypothetical protein
MATRTPPKPATQSPETVRIKGAACVECGSPVYLDRDLWLFCPSCTRFEIPAVRPGKGKVTR